MTWKDWLLFVALLVAGTVAHKVIGAGFDQDTATRLIVMASMVVTVNAVRSPPTTKPEV